MIKRHGDNVSPCSIPATMLKWSESPSGERTFTFVFRRSHNDAIYSIIMAATVSLGRLLASSI